MTKAKARLRAKANAAKKKKRREAATAQPENAANPGHFDAKSNTMKHTGGRGGVTRMNRGSARSR